MWSSALPSLSLFSSPCFSKWKQFLKRPKKFTQSMWKALCSKTLLGKHFLFGALAWHTGDGRHKAFLFPPHLNASVLQRGALWSPALEPWQMWWGCSCSCESPLVCANSSPRAELLLYLLELLLQQTCRDFFWVLFGRFRLLLLFGIWFWGGFCRAEKGITHEELQDLCCASCSLSKTRGWQRLMAAQKI